MSESIPLDEHETYLSFIESVGFGYMGEAAAIAELIKANKVAKYIGDTLWESLKQVREKELNLQNQVVEMGKMQQMLSDFKKGVAPFAGSTCLRGSCACCNRLENISKAITDRIDEYQERVSQ